jgi:hypothetical protein
MALTDKMNFNHFFDQITIECEGDNPQHLGNAHINVKNSVDFSHGNCGKKYK